MSNSSFSGRPARIAGSRLVVGLLLAFSFACSAPASAGSWWNKDWKFRKEISLDVSAAGANVPGTVQEVPVLLRFSTANFGFFADAKPDGADFRVISGDDKTPLKYHFERYDATNQMAYLWVRLPQITGASKTEKFYVYYGNSSAPPAGEPEGSYDAAQALVLHFGDGAPTPVDSTAYHNQPKASSAEVVPASLIAGGVKFTGGQTISVPASPSLRLLPSQGLTMTAWVKPTGAQAHAVVLSLAEGGRDVTLGIDGTHAYAKAGAVSVADTGVELGDGNWHHLALVAAAGQLTLYVDGGARGNAKAELAEIGGQLTIGGGASGGEFLNAEVDEIGVAKTGRSTDWIRAVALGQGANPSLVVYGADAQKDGGQVSYIGTIASNLTVDGWVVIGICFVMLIIGIVIMVMKAMFLSRVEKANATFMDRYRSDADATHSASSNAGLNYELADSNTGLSISTQFRLFQIGVRELRKRLEASAGHSADGTASPLSEQSLEAIRASIDGVGTRLQQELAARMVLLTIAISGGPFLGLLGTVIGVMITFAAIAASGDVNVNAIAPGIAAALAATVMGLAVAIPCLFGYNWLNSRIKAINADSRVFVDELIARIAESYC